MSEFKVIMDFNVELEVEQKFLRKGAPKGEQIAINYKRSDKVAIKYLINLCNEMMHSCLYPSYGRLHFLRD